MKGFVSTYVICLFLGSIFCVEASAQRTMKSQSFLNAECLYDFESFGVSTTFGQYTLGGFWETGLDGHLYKADTDSGIVLDYAHCCVSGGYMFRLAGTKRRNINLYAGSGVFIGAEILDPMNRLLDNYRLSMKKAEFLYGIYAGMLTEIFVMEKLAIVVEASLPLNFSSRISMLGYDVGLGLKVML